MNLRDAVRKSITSFYKGDTLSNSMKEGEITYTFEYFEGLKEKEPKKEKKNVKKKL